MVDFAIIYRLADNNYSGFFINNSNKHEKENKFK